MPDQNQPFQTVKVKRKSPFMVIAIILGIILICAVGVYFLLPGLSKPIDLGVKPSTDTYPETIEKLSSAKHSALEATKDSSIRVSLGSEEVTSLISENPYISNNVKAFQIRINPDDTMEVSATVNTSFILADFLKGEYSKGDLANALPLLKALPDELNFYCKISQESGNSNATDFQLQNINLMGVSISENFIDSEDINYFMAKALDVIFEDISQKSGTNFNNMQLDGGKLVLKGQAESN